MLEWINSRAQWPEADFVPTALMRRSCTDIATLTGARFASFEDEGLAALGACAVLSGAEPVVILQRLPVETAPSIYLRSAYANDREHLNGVLGQMGLSTDDVVFADDHGYSAHELAQGAQLKR